MIRIAILSLAVILFYSSAIFACPSGQSCPAGKDCVADSSLCVADSSSTSGSSSEPTTVKDQLGLTFDTSAGVPDVDTVGVEAGSSTYYFLNRYTVVEISIDALFSSDLQESDAQNASTPDPSIFWLDPDLKL